MTEKVEENNQKNKINSMQKYSIFVFISFAMGDVFVQLFIYLVSVRIFDFYENEIGLATGIIAIAFVLYAIWNMVNDPILGYISDTPKKFWSKYGRRLPWILSGGIGTAMAFILIFAVPDLDPQSNWLLIFIWLLVSVCLFDTLFTMFDTNYTALIPDKFRTDKVRLKLASFQVGLGIFGTVLAVVVSPMFIVYGDKTSFLNMALIIGVIGIALVLLQFYGVYENKDMRERHAQVEKKAEKGSFMEVLKVAVKQRSFIGLLILIMLYQTTVSLLLGSIPYLVRFILNEEAIVESYILLGYIGAGLISVPIWGKIAMREGNNKRVFMIGGLIFGIGTIPFLFLNSVIFAILVAITLGFGMIGYWLCLNPIISDVIDEAIAKSGIRQEGLYMGVRTFFGRIAIMLQAIIFALVHILTGFTPGSATQTPLAIFGLRIQMGLIPPIVMTIGVLVFWKLYDLTPEKKVIIREKIKELKV
ncbi:MAG: MFS transporter [Candidatus Lokiarchaeota archaeon]|nr:MFS transporter [Candidatus Lokiarchaeota archaeon]MBD3342658.1 MFS transporter [Candidatus Lokiarchaeota archaeon]